MRHFTAFRRLLISFLRFGLIPYAALNYMCDVCCSCFSACKTSGKANGNGNTEWHKPDRKYLVQIEIHIFLFALCHSKSQPHSNSRTWIVRVQNENEISCFRLKWIYRSYTPVWTLECVLVPLTRDWSKVPVCVWLCFEDMRMSMWQFSTQAEPNATADSNRFERSDSFSIFHFGRSFSLSLCRCFMLAQRKPSRLKLHQNWLVFRFSTIFSFSSTRLLFPLAWSRAPHIPYRHTHSHTQT